MRANEIKIYAHVTTTCDIIKRDILTICQCCDEMAQPAYEMRVRGSVQIASADAPVEPYLIVSTFCEDCLSFIRAIPRYQHATITHTDGDGRCD